MNPITTMPVHSEWVNLSVPGCETVMETYIARPKSTETQTRTSWPGVLLFMEIFGVNAHIRDVAERIASQGYVVAAMNYYHRTTENLELSYSETDVEEGRSHKDQTTREGLLADAKSVMAYLNERTDVLPKNTFGSLGFCFGGHVAYLVATLPEVKATVSFYGGGIAVSCPGGGKPTIDYTSEITGKIITLFGENDPIIPLQQAVNIRHALVEANIEHDWHVYPDTGHGFFCNHRSDYNPFAAQDAWERMLKLFSEKLLVKA